MSDAPHWALVPNANPQAQELATLLDALAQARDTIAEADLAAANLRLKLSAFEAQHRALLRDEHYALGLVLGVLRHIERWILVLSVYTLRPLDQHRLMDRLDSQRRSERERLEQLGWQAPSTRAHLMDESQRGDDAPDAESAEGKERLKKAFRLLARRFHPDLANGEAEGATFGDRMARINALYAHGDVAKLEAMAQEAAAQNVRGAQGGQGNRRGRMVEGTGVSGMDDDLLHGGNHSLHEQVAAAKERLARFDAVLQSLHEEVGELKASPTFALMDAMTPRGRRTSQVILADLKIKTERERASRMAEIPRAMVALEKCVSAYNQEHEPEAELPPFDPYVDQELARLSLEHLTALRPSPKVQRLVLELENIAEHQPAVGRLILLTYVAQLSQRPLPGLEDFEAIAERLEAAGKRDVPPMTLAEALIAAEGLVEYGPNRNGAKVQMALMFRASGIEQAVPLMLRQFTMRQLFRQVLLHLGRAMRCSMCRRRVFAVPLFRLRGLDNLRALVCPHCGTTQSSYFLPKGRDIQTVLNAAYLELDLVHEYTCSLARTSIGLQLLPVEAAAMTVSGLRNRLHQEVFARHNLPVLPRQIIVSQQGEALREHTLLTELLGRRLTVNLAPGTPLGEAAALETLRFRIRNRFRNEPSGISLG